MLQRSQGLPRRTKSRLRSRGESPVVVLGPGCDSDVIAQDFFDFLEKKANGTL